MKVKIQIKNWWSGVVLFELETENNTILQTLKEALKSGANLRDANLHGANLHGANLHGADLSDANLHGANLHGANLHGADLHGADLSDANLHGANLHGANLSDADLSDANLRDANLHGADLSDANLHGAKDADFAIAQTLIVSEGDMIGWKKCRDGMLVKLLIPADAKRHNATGRKCRAEFADVLEIIDMSDETKKPTQAISQHDKKVVYKVGKRMIPDHYDPDRWNECAGGIHFFITKIEAINY